MDQALLDIYEENFHVKTKSTFSFFPFSSLQWLEIAVDFEYFTSRGNPQKEQLFVKSAAVQVSLRIFNVYVPVNSKTLERIETFNANCKDSSQDQNSILIKCFDINWILCSQYQKFSNSPVDENVLILTGIFVVSIKIFQTLKWIKAFKANYKILSQY